MLIAHFGIKDSWHNSLLLFHLADDFWAQDKATDSSYGNPSAGWPLFYPHQDYQFLSHIVILY